MFLYTRSVVQNPDCRLWKCCFSDIYLGINACEGCYPLPLNYSLNQGSGRSPESQLSLLMDSDIEGQGQW